MSKQTIPLLAALILAYASPVAAQPANDPVTRFLNGFFKQDEAPAAAPPAPAETAPQAATPAPPRPKAKPAAPAAPRKPPEPQTASPTAPTPPSPPVAATPAKVVPEAPKPAATPPATAAPPASIPTSPTAALERVNGYFNGIDQLTAYFVQTSGTGQKSEGTLALKRPGQLRFAYAPPSTLEVVSDGRSVAIRDKKLGTNDVYPVGQTPLKFLLKDQFDLARDTQLRDVQTAPDGMVTVKFEDSATFGGTSKVTLRFDARAGQLKQWTVVDPQGFETNVTLSDVNVVQRASARAGN
jgi:outer membrane lipoprotein-sorting protein